MSDELKNKKCKPCEEKTGRLPHEEVEKLSEEIDRWHIIEDKSIEKTFKFADFATALAFVNKVGVIAEAENHHPDIHLTDWNKVMLSLSTQSIGGLSENDFILAAKIDEIGR
ncbi:MAG: 4a-hydroxytetrahydrobiopterin dehydratase [Patescibacteria group bacterium]